MRVYLVFLVGWVFGLAVLRGADATRTISFVVEPRAGRAAAHGLNKLEQALTARAWTVERVASLADARGSRWVIAGTSSSLLVREAGVTPPNATEAHVIAKTVVNERPTLVLAGADDRGLMYAALDTADRVRGTARDEDPFGVVDAITEKPHVRDRSLSVYTMNRAHWESRFYDERYWARYFDTLAASRFNRFLIVFGYENGGFLAPPYPYFFPTPGFPDVRMVDLTAAQQQQNLAALNRLIELAHDRGIAVSVGIWDHIYRGAVQAGGVDWLKNYEGRPVPNTVQGVTTENLNAYTLASLQELLARVPGLDGIQFRVHEESGLKREEMDGFWRQVFAHVRRVKPTLLLETRGKGTPDSVIETALAQGVALRIETKYWMEQMGLPFHPTQTNLPDRQNRRHGYADFLRHPQRYEMNWRLWNGGTTRVLLWGDPEYVRRFSASTALHDSPNWDVQEPLATKMEAQRPDLPTFDLMPDKYRHYDYEFERYWHFFQVWGRLGYNPQTSPALWQREFARRFGAAGEPVAAGLHRASQVLPMIVAAVYPYSLFPTTRGWAERQSLGAALADYATNEGTDVEQFESFADASKRIIAGGTTTKRTPDATSRWFHATADAILAHVKAAESAVGPARGREFDATIVDLKILAQLARFHGHRAIGAVRYNLFKRSLRLAELVASVYDEKAALGAWRELVAVAGDRYAFDLAMGARNHNLSGHWRDELKKLEVYFQELEDQCCPPDEAIMREKVWQPAASGDGRAPTVEHTRIANAPPGQPLRIVARVTDPAGVATVRLRYRHVTQFEDYATLELKPTGKPDEFAATVPGAVLVPQWDFMYFIEAIDRGGAGANWPDLAVEAPYVIVKMQRPETRR